MKIVNLSKNEAYQLSPDSKLEVERTNPFFNDYGESTTPLEIPASEVNRAILDFPDVFGRREKMTASEVAISDGEFFQQCRQIVLSAKHKGTISTSFYLNDGSFYSRIQDIKLKDIFGDEKIAGLDTVEKCIQFCRDLRAGTNTDYAIFPVLLDNDSGLDTGFDYKILNAFGKSKALESETVYQWVDNELVAVEVASLSEFYPNVAGTGCDFYNAVQRTEYVDSVPITLAPGYYISPFIKANYVLRRVFAHFGYTLSDNFFTQTAPFTDMVLINNVIDVMANGYIRIADLLPDVTCKDFFAVFCKKFCCEFTANEGAHTAGIIFLKDMVAGKPVADLTHCMTAEPTIEYKTADDYKRIVLSSQNTVSSEAEDSYDDMADMLESNPSAYFNPVDCSFYKDGYSGNYIVRTKIGEASQAYNTGEDTEDESVEVPDCIPEFRTLTDTLLYEDENVKYTFGKYLYIGAYNTLNSKMVIAAEDETESSDSANALKPILAFTYISDSRPVGTISAYDLYEYSRTFGNSTATSTKLWDYSLAYWGEDGIFERFYRDYDLLLRNSLQTLKVKLLLSNSQKMNLAAHAKVVIRGVAFFFNKLKFTLGGKEEPVESELRTVSLATPVNEAEALSALMPAMSTAYKWVGMETVTEVSKSDYDNAGLDQDRTFVTVYPPVPTAALLDTKYGEQTSITSQQTRHSTMFRHSKYKYTKTVVWLLCTAKT